MIIKNFASTTHSFKSLSKLEESAHCPRKTKTLKGATPTPTPNREEFHSFQTTTSCKKFPPCQHPPTGTQIHVRVPKKPNQKEKKNTKNQKKTSRFLNCTSRQPLSQHLEHPAKTTTPSSKKTCEFETYGSRNTLGLQNNSLQKPHAQTPHHSAPRLKLKTTSYGVTEKKMLWLWW